MQAAVDWNGVIERNREALKRILASLVAMAGLGGAASFTSPLWGGRREAAGDSGASTAPARQSGDCSGRAACLARPSDPRKGEVKAGPAVTLPRHLHRAVAKLLRPAEAAARRLVVIAARGIVAPPPRPRKPKPATMEPILRRLGIAVMASPADFARIAAQQRKAARRAGRPARPRTLSLPLFDPRRMPRRWRPIQRSQPRILFPCNPDFVPAPLRPLPTPYDQVSGARLVLRLAALARALDDLPGHALRFARLRASRKAAAARDKDPTTCRPGRRRFHRSAPLKPGHPPGWRKKPTHEVHEVLKDLHHFAFYELEKPDTS